LNESILIQIVGLMSISIVVQWLCEKKQLPSILFHLLFGIVIGPILGWVKPDSLFHDLLFPLVSMSVALILFEGGLTLNFSKLGSMKKVVIRICTLGAFFNFAITTVLAHFIFQIPWSIAMLYGSMLIVTGPTVIAPMMRTLKLKNSVSSTLKWEGVITDPYAAVIGVIILHSIIHPATSSSVGAGALSMVGAFLFAGTLGCLGGYLLIYLISRNVILPNLHVPISIILVLNLHIMCNHFWEESGLVGVTVMGLVLANQKRANIQRIVQFKMELQTLIIPVLFTLLAARLDLSSIKFTDMQAAIFLVSTILISRPISIFLATAKTEMTLKEKIFLGFFAPRGIVAVAVTSLFSLELARAGSPHADTFMSGMILTILGTVIIYSLLSTPLSLYLKIKHVNPKGVLIVGADLLAREISKALHKLGFEVLLVDTNLNNVLAARMEGLKAEPTSIFSESLHDELNLSGMGKLIALTPSESANSLACTYHKQDFGVDNVYELGCQANKLKPSSNDELGGRRLFGNEITYESLLISILKNAGMKSTKISAEFTFEDFRKHHGGDAIPLFIVGENGDLIPVIANKEIKPNPGETLISIVSNVEKSPSPVKSRGPKDVEYMTA